MEFEDYFKKMCGIPDELESVSFSVNGTTTPFNKKELRWLKEQLETCIEYSDPASSKTMYKSMLKKVDERLELL